MEDAHTERTIRTSFTERHLQSGGNLLSADEVDYFISKAKKELGYNYMNPVHQSRFYRKEVDNVVNKALAMIKTKEMEEEIIEMYSGDGSTQVGKITPARAASAIQKAQRTLRDDDETTNINKKELFNKAFQFLQEEYKIFGDSSEHLSIFKGKLNRSEDEIPPMFRQAKVGMEKWLLIRETFEEKYLPLYLEANRVRGLSEGALDHFDKLVKKHSQADVVSLQLLSFKM